MCSQADDPSQHGDTLRAALEPIAHDPQGCNGPHVELEEAIRTLSSARPAVPEALPIISDVERDLRRGRFAASAALEPRQNHCPGCDGNHA